MAKLNVGAAWIVAPILLMGASSIARESLVKCGAAQAPLFAVDGQIKGFHTDSSWSSLSKTDIYWFQVVCMDPQDSTFRRGYGIPVVSVWTAHGPASHLEPTLTAILQAQDANFRESSDYVDRLEELDLAAWPAQMRVSMEVRDDGWIATASVDRFLAKCFVFDGAIPAPHSRLSPRQPKCLDDRDLGS